MPKLLTQLQQAVTSRLKKKRPHDPRLQAIYDHCRNYAKQPTLEQAVNDTRFVVIDTETTGFKVYAGDEMISIAMLEYQGLVPTGREYLQFINPGRAIPPSSTEIHGIRDEDVRDSPAINTVMPDIAEFIGDAVLIGHHINFDLRFLNKYLKKMAGCQLRNLWLDTMLLFTSHTGRIGHYSLESVTEHCKITVHNRHSARGDAVAAAAIFTYIAPLILNSPQQPFKIIYNQQFDSLDQH